MTEWEQPWGPVLVAKFESLVVRMVIPRVSKLSGIATVFVLEKRWAVMFEVELTVNCLVTLSARWKAAVLVVQGQSCQWSRL